MPDRRAHRGPHPEDSRLFAPPVWPQLQAAVGDLSWLLSRGYAEVSSLAIVGDRYRLQQRQRTAVRRAAASVAELEGRASRRVHRVAHQALEIDGFNLLTTVEAALSGGVLLYCRDSSIRDMASVHGSYRIVEETLPALLQIGQALQRLEAGPCLWLLDQPVSNSGRLAERIRLVAQENGWGWQVELVPDPDRVLKKSEAVVVTSDSQILDCARGWFNLAEVLLIKNLGTAVDLRLSGECPGGDARP